MTAEHFNTRRTVVVEARKDPRPACMLDALADGCADLGFNVIRWRGPLSGRLPYSRWLPPCDAAILFNGAHPAYQPVHARLRTWHAATVFVELGWFPQIDHYQLDPLGVNAAASWCAEPLTARMQTPLIVRKDGDLLVILQLNDDTQITEHSPWFANMSAFVQHIATNSALPIRVRAHPLEPAKQELQRLVRELGCAWDDSPRLADSLPRAKAVACINSSAAVEAMSHHLPILSYGHAVYRKSPAVYCLTNDPTETQAVTQQLADGYCELSQEAVAEMIERIQLRQWKPAEVPAKLPGLLQSLTWPEQTPCEANPSWQQAYRWITNLPARILYRHRWRESVRR